MNRITLEELKSITTVLGTNLEDEDEFDYVRIVSIADEKYEETAKNPLYFITYITDEEKEDGWYTQDIDLRRYMDKIMREHPNYTFLIDRTMIKDNDNANTGTSELSEHEKEKLKQMLKNNKIVFVDNIHRTMNDMFNYVKNKSHAKTVAVTGSVGKTTCVGLIESILKQQYPEEEQYKVMRIYSKRITPLILKANIINLLNDDIDYITLENSIYYHDHVKILADLLKPEIAAILNIESSHLGVDGLKTIDDICRFKAAIMQYARKGYIIEGDEFLDRLHMDDGYLKYNDETILRNPALDLERIDINKTPVKDEKFIIEGEIEVDPFFLSNLSKKQFVTAYKIGKTIGLTNEQIKAGMDTYEPVENRLQKETAFGKEIIFDGDITTFERIKELSDNLYDTKYLVLRKVGSAENTFRIANIKEHFKKYNKVFLFDDVEYLEELKDEPNVEIVNSHDFMKDLEGTIIYHYSGYFRVWEQYEENNLNIYDREKYKIIKDNPAPNDDDPSSMSQGGGLSKRLS